MREDTKKAILSPTDASRSEYCWDARMNWVMIGIAILAFEICIAIYAKDGFIRYYLGDVLAAAMLYAFGRAAFRLPPKILALAVFTISLVIEIAQYFKVLEILGVQNYALWIIFGGTFDWTDIICYAIGCVLAYVSENFIGSEHAIYNEIRIFRRKRLPKNFNEILQSGDNEKIKAVFEIYDINATDKDGNTILHMLHANKDIKKKDPNSPYAYADANLIEWIIMQGGNINAKNKKGETPLRNFMWYVYKNLKPHQKLVIVGKQDYTSREYIKQAGEVVNIDFGIMYNYIYNLLPEKSQIYIWRRFGKRLEYLYVPEYPTDMEKYDPQEYSEFTYDFWMKFLRQKDSVQYKMIHAATNLYWYWDYNGEYGRWNSWDDEYTDKAAAEIKKYFKLGNRLEELNDEALDKMFYNLRKSWHAEDVGKLRYLFVLWLLKNPEPFFQDEI
ncbi:ribosomal maturation YjgA family protein [Campylobacter concisus]